MNSSTSPFTDVATPVNREPRRGGRDFRPTPVRRSPRCLRCPGGMPGKPAPCPIDWGETRALGGPSALLGTLRELPEPTSTMTYPCENKRAALLWRTEYQAPHVGEPFSAHGPISTCLLGSDPSQYSRTKPNRVARISHGERTGDLHQQHNVQRNRPVAARCPRAIRRVTGIPESKAPLPPSQTRP